MDENYLSIFKELAIKFKNNGFKLYLVGGAVRDYILGKNPNDLDFVTDATISDIANIIPEVNFMYGFFGKAYYFYKGFTIDLNTIIETKSFKSPRNIDSIVFGKDIKRDSQYRDLTINALYMDIDGNIYDFCNGKEDLSDGIIKSVETPIIALERDPVIILRAVRLAGTLNFTIEDSLFKQMKEFSYLLNVVSPIVVNLELQKIFNSGNKNMERILKELKIKLHY